MTSSDSPKDDTEPVEQAEQSPPAEAPAEKQTGADTEQSETDTEQSEAETQRAEGDAEEGEAEEGEAEAGTVKSRKPSASERWAPVLAFLKERYLGIDLRWLGVFRICLGVMLCVDAARRMVYARAFFTNDGILPNHYSLFRPMGRYLFSLYHAFSTYEEVQVAFGLTFVVFFLFTIGYRTRLFHVLAAICITSLNARNIFVENGGTVVVNIVTVYSMFLPTGERFSLDAVLRSLRERRDRSVLDLNRAPAPERSKTRTYSLVMLLFLVQWTAIYFFNVVHKSGKGWLNGSALHWFYQQDRIVTVFGIWVRENVPEAVLTIATYSTLVMEGALALLILFPFGQTWTRRVILVLVWSLHGMIALSSRIGPFSYAMSLFPLLLLGAKDFELVGRWFGSPSRRRQVVFNTDAPIGFQVARILDRVDPFERLEFLDPRQAALLPPRYDQRSFLFVYDPERRRSFKNHAALAEALRVLPFGFAYFFLVWLPPFSWLIKRALVGAKRRQRASRWWALEREALDPGTAPDDLAHTEREVAPFREELRRIRFGAKELVVGFLGTAVVMALIHDNHFINRHVKINRPEWSLMILEYPRLLQGWGMFAPEPPFDDGRVVIDGRTKDGRKLDPLTGKEPDFDPHAPNGWDHNQFWCDYHNRIRYANHAGNRQHLTDYLLRVHRYNGRPEDELVAFDAWWVQDQSPHPGEKHGKPMQPLKLTSHGRVKDSGASPWLKYPKERPVDFSKAWPNL